MLHSIQDGGHTPQGNFIPIFLEILTEKLTSGEFGMEIFEEYPQSQVTIFSTNRNQE